MELIKQNVVICFYTQVNITTVREKVTKSRFILFQLVSITWLLF